MEINEIIKRYTVEIGQEDWLLDFLLISKISDENIDIKKSFFNINGIYAIYRTIGQGDLIIHIKIRNKEEISFIQNKIKKYYKNNTTQHFLNFNKNEWCIGLFLYLNLSGLQIISDYFFFSTFLKNLQY
jgi:hypothetical protein